MITQKLEQVIDKYQIKERNQIIYGTNIPMPNKVIPTPWKTYITFDQTEFYFFLFNEQGISLYTRDGEDYALIPWENVINFTMKHIFILGKMTIQTEKDTYHFQINRFVFGCPWIKANRKYLEEKKYFYPKTK